MALLGTGDWDRASALFESRRADPGLAGPAAALALGNLRLELRDFQGAEAPLRQCFEAQSPLRPYAALLLSRCLHGLGRDGEALPVLQALPPAGGTDSFSARVLRLRAQVLASLNRPGEEAELWRQVAEAGQGGRREEAFFRRAQALESAGRDQEAARAYEAIAFERLWSPYVHPARLSLGRLEASGRLGPRRLGPPEALRYAGRLLKNGHAGDALEVLAGIAPEALRGSAGQEAAYLRLSCLYAARDNAGAVAEADAIWEREGPTPPALQAQLRAGWALLRIPDRAGIATRAQRVLSNARSDQAAQAEACLLLGTAAFVEGDWAEAEAALRSQEGLRGEGGTMLSGLYKRAWSAFMLGHLREARALFQRTAQRSREEGYRQPALYWAARCALLTGDLAAGFRDLSALAASPPAFWSLSARDFLVAAGQLPKPEVPDAQALPRWPESLRRPETELARALDLCGMEQDAAEAFEPFYRTHRKDRAAASAYALLLAEGGHGAQAASVLSRTAGRLTASPEAPAHVLQVLYPAPALGLCREAAARDAVPLPLLLALIRRESGFDPEAYSPAGAAGLMQLMPETAAATARELEWPDPTPESLLEPATNVRLGTRYLAGLMRRFPVAQAVASYNAGEDVVSVWAAAFKSQEPEQFMAMIPYLETRKYVARVLYDERIYGKLYGAAPTPGDPAFR